MIAAKCTQCGANITVDDTKEAGICEFCGTAFITEKVINNYNITNNFNIDNANITVTTTNIEGRLSAAEKLVNNGFLEDAQTLLYQLINEFPEDYRPCFFFAKNAYEYRNVSLDDNEYFLKARALADMAGLKIINEYYSKFKSSVYDTNPTIVNFCEKADLSKLYYCYLKWYYSQTLDDSIGDGVSEGYGYWGFEPVNGKPTIVMYTKNKKYGYVRNELSENNRNCTISAKVHNKKVIAAICCENGFAWLPEYVKNEITLKCDVLGYDTTCRLYITQFNDGKAVYNDAPEDMVYGDVFRAQSTDLDKTNITKGCYIASCVYGSYDCPQVWTLRRYRDNTLASTWYGRAFIHIYYAISPTIVKWFGNTQWFKNLWKNKLDKMVSNLKSNGVKDTPYQDQNWR